MSSSSSFSSLSYALKDALKDILTSIDDTERSDFVDQYGDEADIQDDETVKDWIIRVESTIEDATSHTFFKCQLLWDALNSE